MAWLRRNVTRDGVVTTSDSWLVHHLTGEFVTDPSTASRSLLTDLDTTGWDDELLGLFGLGDERLPTIVPCDAVVGVDDRVRRHRGRRRVGRRPAGRARRRRLPAARRGEVHVRDRRVPAGQHRRHRDPLHGGAGRLGRLAGPRAEHVLRRRAGLHGRLRGALDGTARLHHHGRRPGRGRRTRQRRGARRPGARRARRAVVATRRQGHDQRHDACRPPSGTWSSRSCRASPRRSPSSGPPSPRTWAGR